jgi:hypothetical protein
MSEFLLLAHLLYLQVDYTYHQAMIQTGRYEMWIPNLGKQSGIHCS